MPKLKVSHIQISNTLVGYCWCMVKPFIAVLMTTVVQVVVVAVVKARHNGAAL